MGKKYENGKEMLKNIFKRGIREFFKSFEENTLLPPTPYQSPYGQPKNLISVCTISYREYLYYAKCRQILKNNVIRLSLIEFHFISYNKNYVFMP